MHVASTAGYIPHRAGPDGRLFLADVPAGKCRVLIRSKAHEAEVVTGRTVHLRIPVEGSNQLDREGFVPVHAELFSEEDANGLRSANRLLVVTRPR